jgi:phosphoribosylanthranilate isomerase
MLVKICGITNREDALAAVGCGANALGFIFHPASARFISPDVLPLWIDEIPPHVRRVGVFVDRPASEVSAICGTLGLDVAQLHGSESAADVPEGIASWKAFRIGNTIPAEVHSFPSEAVLLDGASSGVAFDWSLTREVRRAFLLAGGLTEDNVTQAIEQTRPWGIDVSSSLELYPGKKDHARMARFLKACQQAFSTTY